MGKDRVPTLDDKTVYSDWKKRVAWWETATSVKPEARAATLIMNMFGKPEEVAIQLNSTTLSVNGGVKLLIAEMDKLYEKDQTQSIFTAIDTFLSFRRPKDMSMEEYIREFSQRHKNLLQRRGKDVIFEDGILAYFLLHHANLSDTQKTLIRATISDLSYTKMEEQLKRAYGEECSVKKSSSSSSSSSSESDLYALKTPGSKTEVKAEPTFFQQQEDHYYQQYYEQCPEEVFYQQRQFDQRQRPPYRGRPQIRGGEDYRQRPVYHNRNVYQPQQRSYSDNKQTMRHQTPSSQFNPYQKERDKKRDMCHTCGALGHHSKDCEYNVYHVEDKGEDPDAVQKMTFFKSEFTHSSLAEHWRSLIGETTNKALIDTGAVSTVCGREWYENFWKSLSEKDRREVKTEHCEKSFLFGDGQEVKAVVRKKLPVSICGVDILLSTCIVENDIPLLISAESMTKMRLLIDLNTQTVQFMGKSDSYQLTKSGHIVISIKKKVTAPTPQSSMLHRSQSVVKQSAPQPGKKTRLSLDCDLDVPDDSEEYPIILPRVPKKQPTTHQKTFEPYKLYCSSDSESGSDEESPTQPVLAPSEADRNVDVELDEEEPNIPGLEGEEEPPSLSSDSAEWEKIVPSGTKEKEKILKLKNSDVIRFSNDTGVSWTKALVIGRAGKASGVNRNKFNLQLEEEETEEPLCVDLGLTSVYVERLKS